MISLSNFKHSNFQIIYVHGISHYKTSKRANISVGGTSTSKLHDKLGLIFSYVELAVMECQNNTSGLW